MADKPKRDPHWTRELPSEQLPTPQPPVQENDDTRPLETGSGAAPDRLSEPDRASEPAAEAPEAAPAATRAVDAAARAAEWGVLIALFFGAAGIAFVLTTMFVVKTTPSAPVADLVGKPAWEAAVWLAEREWTPVLDHFEDSEEYPPHTVVFMKPAAGSQLRPGAVVRLTISRGGRRIPMPNVRGIRLEQARLILGRNGLSIGGTERVHHPDAAEDVVLATNPSPTVPLAVGDSVRLLVSAGPAPRRWIMPEVVGMSRDVAADMFEQMGLQVGTPARLYDPDEPAGMVLEQFPTPGVEVTEGRVVRMTVNERARTESKSESRLVALRIPTPQGFAPRDVVVRVVRDDWTRIVAERRVEPGEVFRTVVLVSPGDRVIAKVDDREVLRRRY